MRRRPKLQLFFAPDTCARVTMVALEEAGCDYDLEVVAFMQGQHRSTDYLAINPKGKVPVLVVDGKPLTENLAILYYLARTFPDASLLPAKKDEFEQSLVLADLAYCASGLHPIVTRLRIPQFFCDTPGAKERVYELAETAMRLNFDVIEERLAEGPWWYGDQWSIVDAYINWIWFRVVGTGFDTEDYPRLAAHDVAIGHRPSVQRMLNVNAQVTESLAARGLAIQFDGPDAVKAAAPKSK